MIFKYIILFFLYSFLGWLMEVLLTLVVERKFVDRGFLLGFYCPIYGVGCLLLIMMLRNYTSNIFVLYALTFLICSILEYLTSYLLEKIFKLRWWDYHNLKFNINGRICLETMLPFSLMGVFVIKYFNPYLLSILNNININILIIISIILISIFLIDIIISFNIIFNLKHITENIYKDSTEEIKKEIKKFINNNKYLYDRIIKAFPHIRKVRKKEK